MHTHRAPAHHRLRQALHRLLTPSHADLREDRGSFLTEYPVGTALIVAALIVILAIITNGLENTANTVVSMLPGSE
ncbi:MULTISPECIES: Flp family type IVb pilin [unclassified Nocardiopsis]|uniref:Flp family type IVb pilin n=1 Tax=Nocardiopsis TaxID=2013 RepID=UPI00387ABC06